MFHNVNVIWIKHTWLNICFQTCGSFAVCVIKGANSVSRCLTLTAALHTTKWKKCVCWSWCIFHSSYPSRLPFEVDVFPRRNLPLISVQVGWEELEREVGTCRYEGLWRNGKCTIESVRGETRSFEMCMKFWKQISTHNFLDNWCFDFKMLIFI